MHTDEEDRENDKTIIVKRIEMIFNDKECLVLNFTDITPYKSLTQEKERSLLLKTLNASVHDEMKSPL